MLQKAWNTRYDRNDYVFGTTPNAYLAGMYREIPPGRVLLLAAGEGRNAVFLAEKGYDVTAVDISDVGLEKARLLAREKRVEMETICCDCLDFEIGKELWDGIVMIFLHLPGDQRHTLRSAVAAGLKPGGTFLYEAFAPDQLEYASGGPSDPALLADIDEVLPDLGGLEILHAGKRIRLIDEAPGHFGRSAVVQVTARKMEDGHA